MRPIITYLLWSLLIAAEAQDFQGSAAILKRLGEAAKQEPAEKKADPVEELRLKVKALREEASALAPAEAAKRWLALLDAYLTIPPDQLYSQRAYEDRLTLGTIVTALPPPAAWDEIGRRLADRKTANALQDESLRLLVAVLRGDAPARQASLDQLRATLAKQEKLEDYQREQYQENIDELTERLAVLAGTDADRLAAFEKRLTLFEKGDEKTRERSGDQMEVPDLVRFSNEEKATALLPRVLKLGLESVSVEGRATRLLAAKLALEHVEELKKPLWDLVHTLDHAPLFEALRKKFPKQGDYQRRNAAEVYLLTLIAADRVDEAAKLVKEEVTKNAEGEYLSLNISGIDEMGRQGLGTQVLAFLKLILTDDPAMPYWREFIELAARQDKAPDALKLLEQSLAKPDLGTIARAEMQSHHYLALLAADERDKGVEVLRALVKAGPRKGGTDGDAQAQEMRKRWEQVGVHVTPEMLQRFQMQARGSDDGGHDHIGLCTRLGKLGSLLERPELIDEAITAALAMIEALPAEDRSRESLIHGVVPLLLDHQRGPKAEELITAHLVSMLTPTANQRGRPRLDDSLGLLALIYERAGRHADVLAVFEQSPQWSAPDLAAYESNNADDTPFLLIAARALAAVGRTEDARRVVLRAVQDYPGKDAVYELLLSLGADQPLPGLLDEIAKRDRFQERPLIWKARVLLDAGRIDEAEKSIRAAIAIDPSDGEQGKGDRMRAYAVLADVLDKKGDADTAKIIGGPSAPFPSPRRPTTGGRPGCWERRCGFMRLPCSTLRMRTASSHASPCGTVNWGSSTKRSSTTSAPLS